MKKIACHIILLFFCLQINPSFSIELKIPKDLKKLGDEIKKELEKNSTKEKVKDDESKTEKKEVPKETNQSSKLEALNQNISTSNQVKLIYCKVSAIREFLRDSRSNKKGDKVKVDYYIFDVEEDLQSCSNYKAPWSNSSISKLNIISSDLSNPKDAENYWVNRTIEYYNSINVKVPIGQNVSLKTSDPNNPRLNITKEIVLSKADLVRYCIGGDSKNYQNRRSIQLVSFEVDIRDNKIITAKCRTPSGSTRDDNFVIVPVSKGVFSKDDIKKYSFNSQTEIKNLKAAIETEKKQKEQAKAEEQKKEAEYKNSPEGKLLDSYKNYILIKGFYESRKQYAIQYVSSEQFSNSRSQIKAIEKEITKNNNVNSDEVWNKATQWYEKEWASTMELYKSSGTYTQQAAGTVKIFLMSLNSTYNEVVEGGSTPKKDF